MANHKPQKLFPTPCIGTGEEGRYICRLPLTLRLEQGGCMELTLQIPDELVAHLVQIGMVDTQDGVRDKKVEARRLRRKE